MYDILLNPNTLLCLGITVLVVSFLFFYFKRHISVLEYNQIEQAKVLQSVISNLNRQSLQNNSYGSMVESNNISDQNETEIETEIETEKNNDDHINDQSNLIEVSDDEEESSDDESDTSENNESSNHEIDLLKEVNDIQDIIEINQQGEYEISNNSDQIKIIQLNNPESEEPNLEIHSLNESDDDESDDDESDDDDESEKDESEKIHPFPNELEANLEINNISNPTSLEEKNEQENEIQKDEIQENKLSKNDYNQLKNLNVSVLRSLAEERNLIKQGEKKKTKKELLNLLAE